MTMLWSKVAAVLLLLPLSGVLSFQNGGLVGGGLVAGSSRGGSSFSAFRRGGGNDNRRHDRNDDYDDDDDDDDEPPSISTSPQEFLYRMQRRDGVDVNGDERIPPPMSRSKTSPFASGGGLRGGIEGIGPKKKTGGAAFVCSSCGAEHPQWVGKCGACSRWNTVAEAQRRGGGKTTSSSSSSSSSSWLDGISSGFGGGGSNRGNGGGPVSVVDVYREMLEFNDGVKGDGRSSYSSWEEARANGSMRERRTAIPDDPELTSVLGGGIMPGSITLIGGDPGVGKSTLLLQTAGSVASDAARSPVHPGVGMGPPIPSPTSPDEGGSRKTGGPVLYVSGEENAGQIASRALRLGIRDPELLLWCETDADVIADAVADSVASYDDGGVFYDPSSSSSSSSSPPLSRPPSLVVIDSIQTMMCLAAGSSSVGGITQVRECVTLFLRLAKSTGVPVMLVGHVTKNGDVAGPRTVEHMVDCVLYLEGGALLGSGSGGGGGTEGGSGGGVSSLRVLRAAKNRFGSSEEVGVYEMSRDSGRLVPISDPSSFFLSNRRDNVDAEGCAISVALEGIRSMTVEVQALVPWSADDRGAGRRIVDGISYSRLLLILAVLQKRYGISFHRRDVYVNVVGGMHLGSGRGGKGSSGGGGGSDLAVAISVVSSLLGISVRSDTAFVGEVGLLGELRPVHSLEKRISEARRMGFSRIVTPSSPTDRGGGRKRGKDASGPREVSAGGITQLMCENVLDAINCGLVTQLPTKQTGNGPALIKPKQTISSWNRGSSKNGTELNVIVDDDIDDIFLG